MSSENEVMQKKVENSQMCLAHMYWNLIKLVVNIRAREFTNLVNCTEKESNHVFCLNVLSLGSDTDT